MDLATLFRGGTTGRGDPYINERNMFGAGPPPPKVNWDAFLHYPKPDQPKVDWDAFLHYPQPQPTPPHSLTPSSVVDPSKYPSPATRPGDVASAPNAMSGGAGDPGMGGLMGLIRLLSGGMA